MTVSNKFFVRKWDSYTDEDANITGINSIDAPFYQVKVEVSLQSMPKVWKHHLMLWAAEGGTWQGQKVKRERERTAERSIRFQDTEFWFSESFIPQLCYQVEPIFVWLQSSGSWKHQNMCIQSICMWEGKIRCVCGCVCVCVCRISCWAPFRRAPRAERTDGIWQWIIDRWRVISLSTTLAKTRQKDKNKQDKKTFSLCWQYTVCHV